MYIEAGPTAGLVSLATDAEADIRGNTNYMYVGDQVGKNSAYALFGAP